MSGITQLTEDRHACVASNNMDIYGGNYYAISSAWRDQKDWTDFFFNSVLRPFEDYFCSYETGQSVGGVKTGEPREKPPDTPASRTWLVSHVARSGLEPTPDTAVR